MNSFKAKIRTWLIQLTDGSVSLQEKINFAKHLSIVIKAGLPLLEGLQIIRKQALSKRLTKIIDTIILDVSNGQFLAASLSRHPDVFDDFFVNIVKVGETSGTLSGNLLYLADELKKSRALRSKVRSAMIYPIIIMISTVILVSFLIFFAFPKLLPLFESLNVELPWPTKILIAFSTFAINYWPMILAALAGIFMVFKVLFIFSPIRYLFDKTLFYLPVISRLVINVNMANFTRVLAVLFKGGVKIVEAITITSKTFDNMVYRRDLLVAADEVKKGEQLAKYLTARRRFFPLLLSGLIEIGESTGNLEENLEYLSEYYREEAELGIHDVTALLEPLLLLTMGLIVGFVAISVVMPIYQITQGTAGQV